MEYTRSNPLGSALLDIVADNMALHKKLNFKESNLNVGNLCSAFHKHMEGEKPRAHELTLLEYFQPKINLMERSTQMV